MRRLIQWNMLTLDEIVRGSLGIAMEYHARPWGEELQQFSLEQSRSADVLLFGRATYELMSAYWSSATGVVADFINSAPKVVFSRTLKRAHWSNTRLVTGNPEEEVASMKRQPGKDLVILGSSTLSALLVRHGLVDEWRLGLSPVVLGAGNPLPESSARPSSMRLLETRRAPSGFLVLRYERASKARSKRWAAHYHGGITHGHLAPSNHRVSVVDGPFAETKEGALASRGPGER